MRPTTSSVSAGSQHRRRHVRQSMIVVTALAAAACHEGPSMQQTNAAITEELNQIADNTSETAGKGASGSMLEPNGAGQRMRRAATEPPQKH